jgi:phospho-N-acetylmuramoyl-pentapeptide-transferase
MSGFVVRDLASAVAPPTGTWTELPVLVSSVMPIDPNENMAVSLALAGLAFVVTVILGRPVVTMLRQLKFGKEIRADGPQMHLVKRGTPTMGGVMISLTVVLITAVFNLAGRLSMLLPIGVLLAAATLGAADDLMTLAERDKEGRMPHWVRSVLQRSGAFGMTARFKFLWLMGFAVIAAVILFGPLGLHHIYIPFLGRYDIGPLYLPLAVFAIIGTSNGVNLTDGLDTLAAGTAAIAFCSYGIIAYVQGQVGVVTFCFTMVGALMGFLWFNAHPAEVFMGDTGSLALGAALATAAFMTGQWLLLPIVGLVFMLETTSVILQVIWFKWTRRRYGAGRRLFKMTPLHHHFELSGWSETQVTMRFWMLGMMAGLIGVALALL